MLTGGLGLKASEAEMAYSMGWDWFQLHAQQRMQLLSFWFVAMSFLFSGAVMAFVGDSPSIGVVICIAIVASSVVSYFLDLRTQELIGYGERLMSSAEEAFQEASGWPNIELATQMHDTRRTTISYRILFMNLYLGASGFGIVAAIIGVLEG